MIKYVHGDLFANLPESGWILPHVCNCKGGFGSGFVVPLKRTFPIVETQYRSMFPLNTDYMGYNQWVEVAPNKFVVNMIAQTLGGVRPLRYPALVKCMELVQFEMNTPDKAVLPVIAPMFGSALAGGNWDFIEELIKDIWIANGMDVTIFWRDDNIPNSIKKHNQQVQDALHKFGNEGWDG